MHLGPMHHKLRPLAAAALLAACASAHAATSFWDPSRPDEIRLDSVVVGERKYNDVVATWALQIFGYSPTGPNRTYNKVNLSNGQVTLASIKVGEQTYYDVVIGVTGVASVGGDGPIDALIPNDPFFASQWHLQNTGQAGNGVSAKPGEDLNVGKAWRYATGTGIRIAVIDDGLDINHEDLKVVAGKSWDYRINSYGSPSIENSSHGTACAGLAAAIGNNNIGVTGVAFNASVVGYNLLSATTGEYGADSVTKDLADNHVYTNSYGAADGTGMLYPSDTAWKEAISTGITTGRGGNGAIYTWAAGNGAPADRSDYDGQANFHGVMAIGALNNQGQRSSYSEPGANLLVTAYGGEFCSTQTTTTTDISGAAGYNNGAKAEDYAGAPNYTRCMNGTSAATPQAAGVAALMLEANPALTWRDVRAILAKTARKTDPSSPDWNNNGAGMAVNENYGYGVIDAYAATTMASTWVNLPLQKSAVVSASLSTPLAIADNGGAESSTLSMQGSNISKLEFVELSITSNHTNVGDLEIILTSPMGTSSRVSAVRECKDSGGSTVTCGASLSSGFTFGIARLMGEAADGIWTLSVRDGRTGDSGSISQWGIKAYGY